MIGNVANCNRSISYKFSDVMAINLDVASLCPNNRVLHHEDCGLAILENYWHLKKFNVKFTKKIAKPTQLDGGISQGTMLCFNIRS